MDLTDTVVVVTGASRGLGERMARAFADREASVVCAARSGDRLERVVDELNEHGRPSPSRPTSTRGTTSGRW